MGFRKVLSFGAAYFAVWGFFLPCRPLLAQTMVSRPQNRPIIRALQASIPQDTYTGQSADGPCVVSVAHDFVFKDSHYRSLGNGTFNIHVSIWHPNEVRDGYVTGPLAKFEIFSEGNALFPPPVTKFIESADKSSVTVTTSRKNSVKLPDRPDRYVLRNGQIFRTDTGLQGSAIDPSTGRKSPPAVFIDEECVLKLSFNKARIESVSVSGCGRETGDASRSMSCSRLVASSDASFSKEVSGVILPKPPNEAVSEPAH